MKIDEITIYLIAIIKSLKMSIIDLSFGNVAVTDLPSVTTILINLFFPKPCFIHVLTSHICSKHNFHISS